MVNFASLQKEVKCTLSVPCTRLSTYGDWAFPVAAVQIWNSLPQHMTCAPSLPVFCSHLKTHFFKLCYPQLLCCHACEVTVSFLDTLIVLTYLLICKCVCWVCIAGWWPAVSNVQVDLRRETRWLSRRHDVVPRYRQPAAWLRWLRSHRDRLQHHRRISRNDSLTPTLYLAL